MEPSHAHPLLRLGERFGRAERIRKGKEFRQIQRSGTRRAGRFIVVIARQGQQPWTRIGLTVSRKVGKAVLRNLVKRRLREIFRKNKERIPAGMDLIFIARREAATASFGALTQEILNLSAALQRRMKPPQQGR